MTSTLSVPLFAGVLVALSTAGLVALALLLTARHHVRFTADSAMHLPQKIHRGQIPRVGGVAVVSGFVAGLACTVWWTRDAAVVTPATASLLLLALAPIFAIGLVEDVTKRISAQQRLVVLAFGALVLIHARQLGLGRIDVPLLDVLFENGWFALTFSVFACVGVCNAYNIIDGLNGLLGGVALITLAGIAAVAASVGDAKVLALSTLLGAALIGWLPFNWPRARMFAGDGGAYALGFLITALLLLLAQRNPGVSPWFGLVAAALPVWETVYSIWRRTRGGLRPTEPDQAHLHQLVRRWMQQALVERRAEGSRRPDAAPNGRCSPVLWGLHAGAVGLGVAFRHDTVALVAVFVGFTLVYGALHSTLSRMPLATAAARPIA
ncbi:MAG TPA: MraY family glycosyltransferase [Burkholderiaceae bacterium]|nr:MraY family glycosyltransferase [Burkholderiaceae bacterium]